MSVVCVILGIIMIIGGIACFFTPIATALAAGYIIGILLLVFGIFGIIKAITDKGDALDWVLSILAIIVGIFSVVRPNIVYVGSDGSLQVDSLLVYVFIIFFLIEGVIQICIAFKSKAVNPNWYVNLIAGIICVVVGIIFLARPMVAAVTIGFLVAFIFFSAGASLIALGTSSAEE